MTDMSHSGLRGKFPKMKTYPFTCNRRVNWGDMDAYGHVNNTRYFQYFEDARIRYFEQLASIEDLFAKDIAIVVASTSCKFKLPLTYPDNLTIAVKVDHVDDSRFTMTYLIGSDKLGKVVAQGDAQMVAVSTRDGQPLEIPANVRDEMQLSVT